MTTPTNQPSETPRTDLLDQNILHDLLELQAQGGKFSDMISHTLTAYGKEVHTLEKELAEAKAEEERLAHSLIDISVKGQPNKQFLTVAELRMSDLFNDKKQLSQQLAIAIAERDAWLTKHDKLMDKVEAVLEHNHKVETHNQSLTTLCAKLDNALRCANNCYCGDPYGQKVIDEALAHHAELLKNQS